MPQPPHPGGYTPRWPGERPLSSPGSPQDGFTTQGPGAPPAPRKERRGCLKNIFIVFGIFVAVVMVMAALGAIQGDSENPTAVDQEQTDEPRREMNPEPPHDESQNESERNTDEEHTDVEGEPEVAEDEPKEEPQGPTFRGMKEADMVTVPEDWLSKGQVGYNSMPLRHFSTYGTSLLCTTVGIANRSSDEIDFSYFHWELQKPNGVIESPSLFDGGRQTLSGLAELAPEGDVHGDVCFEADPTALPGEYIVLHDASTFFTTKRMAWVNHL